MRIYVGGLPYSTTSESLQDLFGEVGQVSQASVVEDRYSGQSRGFGFVEMPNSDEAQQAIAQFNGYSLGGRTLTVPLNVVTPRRRLKTRFVSSGGFAIVTTRGQDVSVGDAELAAFEATLQGLGGVLDTMISSLDRIAQNLHESTANLRAAHQTPFEGHKDVA